MLRRGKSHALITQLQEYEISANDDPRTFSLQHRRPIMLQTCIAKPEVHNSDCPAIMHDWVQHVSLFELIPVSLYEWSPPNLNSLLRDTPSSQAVTTKLGRFPGDCLVTEGQRFETLITQQWLRMYMWRLDHSSSAGGSAGRREYEVPSDVGKVVMRALGSVQPKYKDCHGVGLVSDLMSFVVPCSLLTAWTGAETLRHRQRAGRELARTWPRALRPGLP